MNYARKSIQARLPSLLNIDHGGRRYSLSILHAHDEEENIPESVPRRRLTGRVHYHPVYHIALVTGGNKHLFLNQRRHPCQRGTLLLVSPNEHHVYNDYFPGRITIQEITFVLECGAHALTIPFHELLTDISGIALPPLIFPVQLQEHQTRRMETLCRQLMERLDRPGPAFLFNMQRSVIEIFAFLVEELQTLTSDADRSADQPLCKACNELERRFMEPLRLADIAKTAGYSPAYFCRAFHRHYGVSPLAYQRELRMATACTMLRSTSMPIKRIAEMTGYGDVYAFGKAFLHSLGLPPGRYRKGPAPKTVAGRPVTYARPSDPGDAMASTRGRQPVSREHRNYPPIVVEG